MAAVAGSKGRLEFTSAETPSLQLALVSDLLDGRKSPGEAAVALTEAACVREVGVDTNMICNLACRYCYLADRPEEKGTVPLDALFGRLSWLASTGGKLFAFIGKEPLADSRAPELLARLGALRRNGGAFRTGLVTNGTLVDRWLDALKDAEVSYIDISVDGLSDNENRLRGDHLSGRVLKGVSLVARSALRSRFATATVLTRASIDTYPEFVRRLMGEGVPTCFSSPVLRFAMSNDVADEAVSLDDTLTLADELADASRGHDDEAQVILDLPYRYTWALLTSGRIPPEHVREDAYEALYWRLPGSHVYFKLSPFSYSYWRALRITHDGRVILNMDLAAHAEYALSARTLADVDATLPSLLKEVAPKFLEDFIARHLTAGPGPLFERGLADQFTRDGRWTPRLERAAALQRSSGRP